MEVTQRKTREPAKVDLCPCLEVCLGLHELQGCERRQQSCWHLAYATKEFHLDSAVQATGRKEPRAAGTGDIVLL